MKRIASLAALIVLTVPALGQTPGFEALLSGKDVPTTVVLKDMNADWRRIAVSAPDGQLGNMGDMMKNIMPLALMGGMGKSGGKDEMMGLAFMSSLFGGGAKGTVYYTKGLTTTVGGETFLIAYKFDPPQMDFMKLMMESQANGGKEPDMAKLAGDSKLKADSLLALTLVNVKSIGTLGSVRPFDLQRELTESGSGSLMDMLMMAGQARTQERAAPAAMTATAPSVAKPAKRQGK